MKTNCRWFAVGLLVIAPLASGAAPLTLRPLMVAAVMDAPSDAPAQLTIQEETQVPGKTLKKGAYTIRVVDHLTDRMIIEVDRDGKTQSTFLALPSSGISKPAGGGPIALGSGATSKAALRGFAFPDGTVAEFVYPKAEAVGLAKKNDTKIPAIDPDSQGMKGNPALSKQDREMVNLWLLSPTLVAGESKPGIKAERYQPQTQTAAVVPPSQPQQPASTSAQRSAPVSKAAPLPQQVASASAPARPKAKPVMSALPHTAGNLPLVWLIGLLSLAGASLITARRFATSN